MFLCIFLLGWATYHDGYTSKPRHRNWYISVFLKDTAMHYRVRESNVLYKQTDLSLFE